MNPSNPIILFSLFRHPREIRHTNSPHAELQSGPLLPFDRWAIALQYMTCVDIQLERQFGSASRNNEVVKKAKRVSLMNSGLKMQRIQWTIR